MILENYLNAIIYKLTMELDLITLGWLIPLMIWEGVWKAIGLWKSAKNSQLKWFICILIFNTAGILPILYLKFFQKKVGFI